MIWQSQAAGLLSHRSVVSMAQPIMALRTLRALFQLACIYTAFQVVAGMYSSGGPVEVLNEPSFLEKVLEGTNPWLVTFYQDACTPCMEFAPEYVKVGSSLKGIIKVGAVDCTKTPKICAAAGIQALPTVKLYPWEKKSNPYTGKWYKEAPVTYNGELAAKKIGEFATSHLPASLVHNISAGNSAEAFLSSEERLPKVVLFSAKEGVTPLYKALALQFRGRLQFAQARAEDEALCEEFEATSFPALYVRLAGRERVKYEGPLKAEGIASFLETYAEDEGAEEGEEVHEEKGKPQGKGGEEAEAAGSREVWVKQLEGAQFEKKVLQDEEVWMVAFLGSSESEACALRRQEWKQASANLTGMVRMGELNATTDEDAAKLAKQYGVQAAVEDPSQCLAVLLFPFGEDKAEQEPEVYSGPLGGKELSAFALEAVPEGFVQQLAGPSVKAFGQMNPQKPKLLLFSSKMEVSPLYKALAANFRKYIAFAQVHSSETEVLKEFAVTRVPHLSFMVARRTGSKPGEYEMMVNQYPGPLKYPQLAAFCNQMATFALGMQGAPSSEAEVPELNDDAGLQKHCTNRGRLCVVGLLTSPGKVDDLQTVAALWVEGGQFAFSWVDASQAPALPAQLGVSPSSLPTVAVLSPAKGRYAVLEDDFSAENLQGFLEGLLVGKVRTSPLEAMPSFSSASDAPAEPQVPPEEEPPVEEEEFSLEDILGEELEGTEALATKGQRLLEVERELEEEQVQRRAEKEAAEAAKASSKKNKKKKKKKVVKKTAAKDEL